MKVCAACGVENPEIARFCLACGTQLAEARPPQETRKVVTIVFSDLKGSTSLGEALDSEALREVMTRYFDAMRGELERHGGVIEKFIGDAVMAVFGLPRLHEDDALRAVRAAAGMQAALDAHQRRARAATTACSWRTGPASTRARSSPATRRRGQRLVTGDAVNVAARLEQAAGEREVLLGELTYRLVRDAVEVEEVEPLELKGKAEPRAGVPTGRRAATTPRRTAHAPAPLVGRGRELEQLEAIVRRRRSRPARARLATVVGGCGRREVAAHRRVLARVADDGARAPGALPPVRRRHHVLAARRGGRGRPRRSSTTTAPRRRCAKLARLAPAGDGRRRAARVADRPLGDEPSPCEELVWATRRLLERLAARAPGRRSSSRTSTGRSRRSSSSSSTLVAVGRRRRSSSLCAARPELARDATRLGDGDARDAARRSSRSTAEASGRGREPARRRTGSTSGARPRSSTRPRATRSSSEQLLSMLIDDGMLRARRRHVARRRGDLGDLARPADDPGAPRGAPRRARAATSARSSSRPRWSATSFAEAAVAALAPPERSAARRRRSSRRSTEKHSSARPTTADEARTASTTS